MPPGRASAAGARQVLGAAPPNAGGACTGQEPTPARSTQAKTPAAEATPEQPDEGWRGRTRPQARDAGSDLPP
eukprot:9432827-Alexandrium_andersonii.AAC.1